MEKDLTQKGQFLRCLIRLGGGGLTPNETLSHSNGKFVFDHGPNLGFISNFLSELTHLCDSDLDFFHLKFKIEVSMSA